MLMSMENSIRLLISNRSNGGIQQALSLLQADPEVEVVGEVTEHLELLLAVRDMDVNAVLLAMGPDEEEGMLSHLFAEYPDLTVLVIQPSERVYERVYIEQRCRHRTMVNDVTPAGVVEALRNAVHSPCETVYMGMTH